MDMLLQTVLQGALLGGLYCLFALGLSLMYGVMRLTNTAQGDFILLGSFTAIAVIAGLKMLAPEKMWLPLLLSPLLLIVAFGFGYVLQRQVLNKVLGKDPLPSLVVTFGLSIVIQNLLLEVFSADPRSIADFVVGHPHHVWFAMDVQPHSIGPGISRCVR